MSNGVNSGDLDDPLQRFARWWDAAKKHAVEPDAMVLSTVSTDGRPSSRVVYLRTFDPARGFVFFTNYQSHKGTSLAANSHCALNFFWAVHERQVRVEGTAAKVSAEESDAYFASRPRESQIGAWASQQSQALPEGQELASIVQDVSRRFGSGPIERPPHWGGYCVTPQAIELWQGKPFRLHHRERYERQAPTDGVHVSWTRTTLYP